MNNYGIFNPEGVMTQSQVDLTDQGFNAPWVLLPEGFNTSKFLGLADNGEFIPAPNNDMVFNKAIGVWSPNIAGKQRDLIYLVETLFKLNLESNILYDGSLYAPDVGNLIVWKDQTLPPDFVWRDSNNINHSVDSTFINGLLLAIATRTNDLYRLYWTHKEAIRQLSTVEEINNYDATTGWAVQISQNAMLSQFNPFNLG
jgi:hypothetical protein